MTDVDHDGQPFNLLFNAARRLERDISEMLGLTKGLLADGVISEEETVLLKNWANARPEVVSQWPGNILHERLTRIFVDGVVTEDERKDLASLLNDLVGGRAGIICGQNAATNLPLNQPPPQIVFPNRIFVFTGKFAFGSRSSCESTVAERGGISEPRVTSRTSYLVIGTFGSRDWVQTSHGRKIELAVEYRDKGKPVALISENHWASAL